MRFAAVEAGLLAAMALSFPHSVPADEPDDDAPDGDDPLQEPLGDEPLYESVVTGSRPAGLGVPEHRAATAVDREDLDRRIPRSAPDALRFEPGVFVQQTAHGQGSAFVRGMTGQQTLLLFDGIRLNNSTYRQGPNQYFFTLDSQTIDTIGVLRGGASTRYGSDALGGVISAVPIEPRYPRDPDALFSHEPHVIFRARSADEERGGRVQTHVTAGDAVSFFGGVGRRKVGMLESAGPIRSPVTGEPPRVPRFAEDGRTQLGTGFEELTADGQLVYRMGNAYRAKTAAFVYRQTDAPRTDQCPAAYAPFDECLVYDKQFRYLVYGVLEGEPRSDALHDFRTTLSWQRQHEQRTQHRPSSAVENRGRDTVDSYGVTFNARTRRILLSPLLQLQLRYGMDTYFDSVASDAAITFTDVDVTRQRSRGQYLDGSRYLYGGLYLEGEAGLFNRLFLRSGGRFSWIAADAPGDEDSGTAPIDRGWYPWVGNAGIEARAADTLFVFFNVDRSFRAPNLDDLTSRQQTGPGFQFENAYLGPEIANTFELGLRTEGPMQLDIWGFWTMLHGAVGKSPRDIDDCPPGASGCQSSWSRFQLVNAGEASEIFGVEGVVRVALAAGFETRATLAWAFGEGPNLGDPPSDPSLPFEERVPLSRIPPLNGTVELLWFHARGFSLGAMGRFAATQDRLAVSDQSDARIPDGGTPGFASLDLSAGYRLEDLLNVSLVFENLFDTPYRYHGSSVNGPGRSLNLLVDLGPLWRY